MHKNAADVLFEFFTADQAMRQRYTFVRLCASLESIRVSLDTWKQLGRDGDAAIFDGAVDRWLQSLYSGWAGNTGLTLSGTPRPEPGDMGLLKMLSTMLDRAEPSTDEAERAQVGDFVAAVLGALKDDDSLPEELRLHIATLIVEIQRCLLDYEIQGDFQLAAAVERLMAVLLFAESESNGKASVWRKVYDDYFRPIMVGLMIAAPDTIFKIAALTTGTTP